MLVSKIVRSCWGCVLRTRWVRAAEKIPRGGEGEGSKEHGDEEEETKDPKDQQAADHPQERVTATVSVTTTVVTVIVVVAVTTVVVVIVVLIQCTMILPLFTGVTIGAFQRSRQMSVV